MGKLFIILLALLQISSAFAAEKKTPAQYWNETRFHLDYVADNYLSKENCYSSAKILKACVDSVNSIGQEANPAVELVPNSLLAARGNDVKILLRTEAFSLVEQNKTTPTSDSFAVILKKLRDDRQKQLAALTVIQTNKSSTPFDFEGFAKDLGKKIPQENFSFTAGQALNAYLAAALDPHTRLQPEEEYDDQTTNVDDSFSGIGAILSLLNGEIYVEKTFEGSGARAAGIKANDRIVTIDGKVSENTEQAVNMLRGPENTTVTVVIVRDKKELPPITITRSRIVIPNIEAKMLNDAGIPFGYVKLRSFMDKAACQKISTSIRKLETAGARGIIFDLRGNGGGFLDQADCIGSIFVGKKVIAKVKDLSDPNSPLRNYESGMAVAAVTKLPMVTLIDAGSASASEVVSGALQDYQRSWIVGERSYGKATVQQSDFLSFPKIVVWQTIERFYQPSGRTNQIVGILPDFEVPAKLGATEEERAAFREEDLPYALPPIQSTWSQPRPQDVKRIQACLNANQIAEKLFGAISEPDYQLYKAEEILSCDSSFVNYPN